MDLFKNFEDLLNQGKDSAPLRFGLGNAYFEKKEFEQALKHFQAAIHLDPNYSAAWKYLGKTLVELNQVEKAKDVFEKGIQIAEKNSDKQASKEMQVFLKRLQKK